tara:strand:+ start:532 stop:789 length:258 start_codon:yes stop_codon:yes gene_type:complete
MAIRDKFKEQEKNGMKITDNMDGEKNATEKLNMKVADVSDKMTIPQIKEYIRRYKTGESTTKYLEKFKLLKPELDELQKLAEKRT